jgi:hypothetical protein
MVSFAPPAEVGTMIVMGRSGNGATAILPEGMAVAGREAEKT